MRRPAYAGRTRRYTFSAMPLTPVSPKAVPSLRDADARLRTGVPDKETLRTELETQTELRRAVTRLSDDEIDGFFNLALTDGIMPIVRSTVRFNQHRDLIRALFRHPPARQFLFRAIVS